MTIKVYLSSLKQQGNLVYLYHPFHNFLTAVDLYEVNNYLIPKNHAVNPNNGQLLTKKNGRWVDKNGTIIGRVIVPTDDSPVIKAGSLIDLDTELLNFDVNHPVDITVLPSYDGSVNLILNDDKNIPKIINSRFSVREKNTYEIVDRIGENDTNIYNSESFEKDASLYFLHKRNPKIEVLKLIDGNLLVGTYCFYFTYCDSDENESDFIAESGPIPIFIGTEGNYISMDGGIKNLNSFKGIRLKLKNIDNSYNYLKVYYVRYFADYQLNKVLECKKLYNKIPINDEIVRISISGLELAEDIDANILNISKFNPKCVLTQAQCKNMLFFGNIVQNTDNYKELSDCALRIIPKLITKSINYPNFEKNLNDGYYTIDSIYNSVGYFNNEYYRFGVVFIYDNGTLSNVYNTLGAVLNTTNSIKCIEDFETLKDGIYYRKYIKSDELGWISQDQYSGSSNLNNKGVCLINESNINNLDIFGISFQIPSEVLKFLKEELHIRGCFFVRQKRIPNLLGLCYLLPMDKVGNMPVLLYLVGSKIKNISESFLELDGRLLTNNYSERLVEYNVDGKGISEFAYAGICPDFLLNLPYYNQIFNGSKFKLQQVTSGASLLLDTNSIDGRLYKMNLDYSSVSKNYLTVTINSVTEETPSIAIDKNIYKLNCGNATEAFRYSFIEEEVTGDSVYSNSKIVRGVYSPYLAISSNSKLLTGELYNIYLDSFIDGIELFQIRMDSSEPFYAISDRYNFDELTNNSLECWRGDCFLNTFTYRLNRNFNDATLPNNDKIILELTWKNSYNNTKDNPMFKEDVRNEETGQLILFPDISRADVNAVQLGSWITLYLRSYMNYALRSIDRSHVAEEAEMGSPRTFYPKVSHPEIGDYKMPDSYLYNDAYRTTLGFKCYFTLNDINYIKNTFSNRILYSAVAIQDSFKNNYRESLSTYYRDYSSEYGGITKLIGFEGHLLVVFEHAIGVAVINERVLTGQGDGEPVFINTNNVLPQELTIISDTFGTLWTESVIKSEIGYVYGVDTVAKKIWRVKGLQLELLSDFKVNKFLIDNIDLDSKELTPTIGLRNVKSHYNNNKKDIMFTFYNHDTSWNLCFNELLDLFITFYSWIPSYSENIDTLYFSFNNNTSKILSLLYKCNSNISGNSGVLLDTPIIKQNRRIPIFYVVNGERNLKILFELIKDGRNHYKHFSINNRLEGESYLVYDTSSSLLKTIPAAFLQIQPFILNGEDTILYPIETVIVTANATIINPALTEEQKNAPNLSTDFYLHGKAGIFKTQETLKPTYWYNEQHPFEFEFVVNDKIGLLKVYNNLVIISNKAEPESFHFEIEGDNYEFSLDKRTMYFRLEMTKKIYSDLGSDITYNKVYEDIKANAPENYRRIDHNKYPTLDERGLAQQVKSTIFPLYYERVDTYNEIYNSYSQMIGNKYDFKNLSGSEIIWDRELNQFNIVTHIKNSPIDKVGRLRGNSYYKEGKWNILIPSIIFNLKNEGYWEIPPLVINSQYVPKDVESTIITRDMLSNIYEGYRDSLKESVDIRNYIDTSTWSNRKEARIRDKWIKIRIRYSGRNLAIIHSITTLYNISLA